MPPLDLSVATFEEKFLRPHPLYLGAYFDLTRIGKQLESLGVIDMRIKEPWIVNKMAGLLCFCHHHVSRMKNLD